MSSNCLRETSDKCVIYTGPNLECVGIKTGMPYDELTVELADKLCEIIERRVELKCLFNDSCENYQVEIPKAVQLIIDKLCSLTSDDISYSGSLFCIGNSSISTDSVRLLGRDMMYSTEPTPTGVSFTYDLTDTVRNLPAGYNLSTVRVKATGRQVNGSSKIMDTAKNSASIKIDAQRFPVTVDVEVKINSPSGHASLVKDIYIPSAARASHRPLMEVRDFTSSELSSQNQTQVIETIAAETCRHKTELGELTNMDISDCAGIQYPSPNIKAIVGVQSAEICTINDRLGNIGSEIVTYRNCDGNDVEAALQSVLDLVASINCQNYADIKKLEADISLLQQTVKACCMKSTGSSGGASNLSGGGGSSGGSRTTGCVSGTCF